MSRIIIGISMVWDIFKSFKSLLFSLPSQATAEELDAAKGHDISSESDSVLGLWYGHAIYI